jgi:hypothetical protein
MGVFSRRRQEPVDLEARAPGRRSRPGFANPSPRTPTSGVVCERKSYVLSMDIVRDNTGYFEALAAQFGGAYDGWEPRRIESRREIKDQKARY